MGGRELGTIVALPFPADRVTGCNGNAGGGENGLEIEAGVEADLLEQIGAAGGGRERWQAEFGKKLAYFFSKFVEEAYNVLGLAAELGAQVRPLRGDARWTGVEVTLACHVATERDEDGGAESKFIGTEQCGDDDVARSAETAVGAQADAAAKTIVNEHLLRFGEAEFPGVAGVLDAGKRARRRCRQHDRQ